MKPATLTTCDNLILNFTDEYNSKVSHYKTTMESKVDIIKCKYKKDKDKIISKYTRIIDNLQSHYNNAIKQLRALYDAFEVTIYQLTAFKLINSKISSLLEQHLETFPNFDKLHLYSDIIYSANATSETKHERLRVSIPYDIYNIESSVFKIAKKNMLFHPRHIDDVLHPPYCIDIKFNMLKDTYLVNVNGLTFKDFGCFIIKELDIIILWIKKVIYFYDNPYVNFIQISTGKLIYTEIFNEFHPGKFMYCNNTLINLHTDNTIVYIKTYSIDLDGKITCNVLPPLQLKLYSSTKILQSLEPSLFYSDSRGLYLSYSSIIAYIGNLNDITKYINITKYIKCTHKKDNKSIKHKIEILQIDYVNYKIYAILHNEDKDNITITLGFNDICNLLY